MYEFLKIKPAHFYIFGGFWRSFNLFCGFLMCGRRGFGLFCSFMVHRPPLFFGVWRLFWPDIYCVKNKNLHAGCCLFFLLFWQKRLKVSLAKMVKKWCENLVMKIILFNTKNNRVPRIRLLCVVKKSCLRLE